MTTAIAAHASARPANQATSAAANAANTAIDASAAPTGDFATTLAAQQAGPVRISSPAATPGKDLPQTELPIAAPPTAPVDTAQPATPAPTNPRGKSARTDGSPPSAAQPAEPDPPRPAPVLPEWNTLLTPIQTANLPQPAPAATEVQASAMTGATSATAAMVARTSLAPTLLARTSLASADTLQTAPNPANPALAPAARNNPNMPSHGANMAPAQARSADPSSTATTGSQTTGPSLAPGLTASAIPMLTTALPADAAAPTLPMPAPAETPTDFATLVDSIARARNEGGTASAAAVGVTLSHGDFGRVSLQFTPRDQGLAVTMHSADPGFAPAVTAAASTGAGRDAAHRQPDQQAPDNSHGHGSGHAPRGDTGRQTGRPPTARASSPGTASDAADNAGIFA